MKQNKVTDETLQALFDTRLELPGSLATDNIKDRLQAGNIKQFKPKKHLAAKLIAAAAAVAIVATGATMLPRHRRVTVVPVTPPTSQSAGEQTTHAQSAPATIPTLTAPEMSMFQNDSDLKAYFANLYDERKGMWFRNFGAKSADTVDDAVPAMPQQSVTASGTQANAESFNAVAKDAVNGSYGQTNLRDNAVDEADVLKNDGRYLYIALNSALSIVDTQTMEKICAVKPAPKGNKDGVHILDAYVQNDRLVVSAQVYERVSRGEESDDGVYYDYLPWYNNTDTAQFVYDISDRKSPVLLREMDQSGTFLQSRMVGAVLYTITQYSVPLNSKDAIEKNFVPAVDGKKLTSENVLIRDKDAGDSTHLVLTAFDTAKKDSTVNKVSIIGFSSDLYCTADTLYLLSTDWRWTDDNTDGRCKTNLYAFALNGTEISLRATGAVPGAVNDDYAMDQYDGYLRITTTDYDYNKDVDVSALYVLNDKLKIVGQLENFAPDEQVQSTRFLGSLAYVVTFRNTDPLFAIDLSDPAKPTILGAVKLPGFSSYLHPLDDHTLLGVGYSGDDKSADWDTVKLSLFDISDPTHPQETDHRVIKQAGTDVTYEPKAFVFDTQRGAFYLPVCYNLFETNGNFAGTRYVLKRYAAANGKFTEEQAYVHGADQGDYYYTTLFRGTFIGDRVYTVSDTTVKEFDLAGGKVTRTVQSAEREHPEDGVYVTNPIVYNGAIEG